MADAGAEDTVPNPADMLDAFADEIMGSIPVGPTVQDVPADAGHWFASAPDIQQDLHFLPAEAVMRELDQLAKQEISAVYDALKCNMRLEGDFSLDIDAHVVSRGSSWCAYLHLVC